MDNSEFPAESQSQTLFSTDELARRWGCSRDQIRAMLDRGDLKSIRLIRLRKIPIAEIKRIEASASAE